MRRLLGLCVAACVVSAGPAQAEGLELTKREQVNPRLLELTFTTPALEDPTSVYVLLPAGYAKQPKRRWPVLYLLHGALDDYKSWVDTGDAEKITAKLPGIVVMPDSGTGGGYVDWVKDDRPPNPQWETYHVGQLLPWVDEHFRTAGTRGRRAIAGLSMGGFGTMAYAARHPDLFASASSFSGAVDTNYQPLYAVSEFNNGDPGALYGPRPTEEVRWRGDNPWDLAENLGHTVLTVRTGNGSPGGPGGDSGDPVESGVHAASLNFHTRLTELGYPHVWDDYGAGGHAWYYWKRDLRQLIGPLRKLWRKPPADPKIITFKAIEPRYERFGWRVAIDRPALEFSELSKAGRSGFTLSGSGAAVVRTPARYAPGTTATVDGKALTVGPGCRLTIPVDLGPGNSGQQYRTGTTTAVKTVAVRIAAVSASGRRSAPRRRCGRR